MSEPYPKEPAPTKAIGFWYSELETHLPHPRSFVDENWDDAEKAQVIQYLKSGKLHEWYCGLSECRFCKCDNGAREYTDGTYYWPEGYVHYLEVHNVKPSQEFIDHVKKRS